MWKQRKIDNFLTLEFDYFYFIFYLFNKPLLVFKLPMKHVALQLDQGVQVDQTMQR